MITILEACDQELAAAAVVLPQTKEAVLPAEGEDGRVASPRFEAAGRFSPGLRLKRIPLKFEDLAIRIGFVTLI